MSRPATEGYEATPHTAEVGLRAWGSTFERALEGLARGLVSLIVDPNTRGGEGADDQTVTLTATGRDREDLAVAWLNEILGTIDADRVVLRDFAVTVGWDEADEDPWRLEARARSERMHPDRHVFLSEVKAATLHGASVGDATGKTPPRVEIRVLLDV